MTSDRGYLPMGALCNAATAIVKTWRRRAARRMAAPQLARLRERVVADRAETGLVLARIDQRLAALAADAAPIPAPLHSDWAWRPEAWLRPVVPAALAGPAAGARLTGDLSVYHDCPLRESVLRQIRGEDGAPPFALALDIFGFAGSFTSLAIDLPAAALAGFGADRIVTATVVFDASVPVWATVRLNLVQGPEHHRLSRPILSGIPVEFDLAAAKIDHRPITAGWLDMILLDPRANRVVLRDLTLTRRPRAEF